MPHMQNGQWSLWKARPRSIKLRDGNGLASISAWAKKLWASTSLALPITAFFAPSVWAQAENQSNGLLPVFGIAEILQLSFFIGAMSMALVAAIWLIRERAVIADQNVELNQKLGALAAKDRRRETLLSFKDTRIVLWVADSQKPEVIGIMDEETGAPQKASTFLSFPKWLTQQSAIELQNATHALRHEGHTFDLTVETQTQVMLAVQGRVSGTNALLKFMPLAPIEKELAAYKLENTRIRSEINALKTLGDNLPNPLWVRNSAGQLTWASKAYKHLFKSEEQAENLNQLPDILMQDSRSEASRAHAVGRPYNANISSVIDGDRKRFQIVDVATDTSIAGMAIDITMEDRLVKAHEHMLKSHGVTLDLLTTAIAQFDATQKLVFYNQAFQQLWDIDTAFLATEPSHVQFIDRLRAEGKLAEQPEWRQWKDDLLSDYQALEPVSHMWHLPNGQTLRVLANPQHEGGLTLIFENLTEQFDLESRYKTLVKVRGQTLDHLAEGVAVFSSDGILRLHNPAFTELWGVDPLSIVDGMHISALRDLFNHQVNGDPWISYIDAVTGFDEIPEENMGRLDLHTGTVLNAGIAHLPDGQTMLTFVDMTDATNVERALKDKNDALRRSDELKTDFVNHVSYELRSPLNAIIGFTDMLRFGMAGPLNEQQGEYIGHIHHSSEDLLVIVNDILDLATIDAGMLHLDRKPIEISAAIGEATSQVEELLKEHEVSLNIQAEHEPGQMEADLDRLSRVLANLLRNAANYAPSGSAVTLSQRSDANDVLFTIRDEGPGIPEEILSKVFAPFEQKSNGGRSRGVGLGLAIAKSFIDLHNGTIEIETSKGQGTTVMCRLPRKAGPHIPKLG